jgi:hypothetical protein
VSKSSLSHPSRFLRIARSAKSHATLANNVLRRRCFPSLSHTPPRSPPSLFRPFLVLSPLPFDLFWFPFSSLSFSSALCWSLPTAPDHRCRCSHWTIHPIASPSYVSTGSTQPSSTPTLPPPAKGGPYVREVLSTLPLRPSRTTTQTKP